jgi:hypothetical protein
MSIERPMQPIPISSAQEVADRYGYDQVVIIGRRVGSEPDPCGEHVTTFGAEPTHSHVAAAAGRSLQRFMRWPLDPEADPVVKALGAAVMALRSYQHGNCAPDLAEEIADQGDAALIKVGLSPATLGRLA